MAEIDDTQLLSLNDFQEVSSFTEDKNIMVWEAANEDPSKISGTNFIASMRQLFIEGVNAFLQVDYFSQTAPVVPGLRGEETWLSYDGKIYEYDYPTSQWIYLGLADENTVFIADAAPPLGKKRRYSVIFRNGTYILLSAVDLSNSINDSTPPSPTTTFSSQKVTELIADEKDPIFNAWLIDNAAYLQILLDDAPTNPSTKFLNGLRQWVDVAVVGGGGYQAPLYLTNLPSFVAGYKQIAYERQVAGFQTDVTLRNETVLVNTFLFEGQIDTTTIDSGNYIFASRAKIDSAGGNTRFRIAPFLRHADGSETVLFTFECDEITYTSYQDVQKSFPYGTINCVETDRFGFRLFLVTSSTSNKTVNLLAGDGYPTFMVTPARLRHNQLRDKNGNPDFLHVTQAEKDDFIKTSEEFQNMVANATGCTIDELVAARGAGELMPGASYRITDYITTSAQDNTAVGGHQFDVIVTAVSTSELSEIARACHHNGDTYFANAKVEAWELKYCIDNDTNRFAWADSINGKGVIYYMKDERDNECPYDFKNILFLREGVYYYTFSALENTTDELIDLSMQYSKMPDDDSSSMTANTVEPAFEPLEIGGVSFSLQTLNFNIMLAYYDEGSLIYGPSSNKFGVNCKDNFFNGCNFVQSNIFGANSSLNTFGNRCAFNTFGTWFYDNHAGRDFQNNVFGAMCFNNTFGDDVYYNVFGNTCSYDIVGNSFQGNTFGNYCSNNKFYHGTVGSTTPKDFIKYLTLENGVRNNNFYSNLTTSDTSYLQRIKISGLENTTTTISLPATNTQYEWLICYTSGGVLKQYCPNDLTNNRTYKIEDTSVPTWAASTKYVDFQFEAQINIADLSESDFVNVVFGVNEANSGNYAAAIEQYVGYILVFSKVNTAITIPTISVTKIDL